MKVDEEVPVSERAQEQLFTERVKVGGDEREEAEEGQEAQHGLTSD